MLKPIKPVGQPEPNVLVMLSAPAKIRRAAQILAENPEISLTAVAYHSRVGLPRLAQLALHQSALTRQERGRVAWAMDRLLAAFMLHGSHATCPICGRHLQITGGGGPDGNNWVLGNRFCSPCQQAWEVVPDK